MRRAILTFCAALFTFALFFASPTFAFASGGSGAPVPRTHSPSTVHPLNAYDCIDSPGDEL